MAVWLVIVAVALVSAMALLWPLMRPGRGDTRGVEAAEYDLRLYRDQLSEVDRDAERGTLSADEAARARTEISRRMLEADRARQAAAAPRALPPAMRLAGAITAVAAVTGSFALYAHLGQPAASDQPITARIAAADRSYAARPDQAKAEAAPTQPKPEVPQDFADILDKLRKAVADNPDDPQGLQFLSDSEARVGNFPAAWRAQQHRIAVIGDQATAEDHAILGELMTRAAGGTVTPEAETAVMQALKMDPLNGRARFYAGLLLAQNGRPDKAFPVWRSLLEQGPQDDPWIPFVRASIADLAWFAGDRTYVAPQAGAPMMPGPDAAQMQAAGDMAPEDRQQMIRQMVEGLNERLATQGGTPDEWSRLISSLAVLGEVDRARAIWTEAQTRFADQPEALATVTQGATQAGLVEGASPAPGPSQQQIEDAQAMSPEDRQAMIAQMVEQLETRLMTEGGSADEWERLFNTLTVINAPDRAKAAWDKAQAAFAGDAATLDRLRAAATAAGVTP
ncbi:c-type cytochrome biogenesis protein CcmI [Paracoccus sp. p3-h83]|uniref:c-type cytochrome biogenesis protein CcmI n=1 Tax=Paracoccus sp. p3-h83 TaxID=3342805 RepID=UPI0035B7C151